MILIQEFTYACEIKSRNIFVIVYLNFHLKLDRANDVLTGILVINKKKKRIFSVELKCIIISNNFFLYLQNYSAKNIMKLDSKVIHHIGIEKTLIHILLYFMFTVYSKSSMLKP